jgi:hypothetical protein
MYFQLKLQPEREKVRLEVRLPCRRLPHRHRAKTQATFTYLGSFYGAAAFIDLISLSDFFDSALWPGGFSNFFIFGCCNFLLWNTPNFQGGLSNKKYVSEYT